MDTTTTRAAQDTFALGTDIAVATVAPNGAATGYRTMVVTATPAGNRVYLEDLAPGSHGTAQVPVRLAGLLDGDVPGHQYAPAPGGGTYHYYRLAYPAARDLAGTRKREASLSGLAHTIHDLAAQLVAADVSGHKALPKNRAATARLAGAVAAYNAQATELYGEPY